MPTATSSPARVELALTVELEPGNGSGLLRALSLLHRRHCRVIAVRYEAAASSPEARERLLLQLQAPPRHAHCVPSWLSSLVEVHRVSA